MNGEQMKASNELHERLSEFKERLNAVIAVHNYQRPEVQDIADFYGDSLDLARECTQVDADVIVLCGVRFMAETAKVLSPQKRVLIADKTAGCSLADDFEISEIDRLKADNPGVPVMIYINSDATAKAGSDVCCTSANSEKIARVMPGEKVIFIPDILFARNLADDLREVKEVIYPGQDSETKGAVCEVHETFTLDDLFNVRSSFEMPKGHPRRMIYAHWECNPEVLREADFYGSTTQIRKDIAKRAAAVSLERVFIASECEMTSNLAQEFPGVQFWTACSVRCQHMAKVTLEGVLHVLRVIDEGGDLSEFEINLDPELIEKARKPIELMLELS